MDKQTFLTMSPSKRVQEVNKLLLDHDLKEISDLIGIPSSSFSKIMREGDYIYHKADKKYYPFVRSEEERLTNDLSNNSDEVPFFKQHEDTMKKLIKHFENKGLLFLDERIYSRDATYSNKSIRMNNAIYEEFSSFCEEYYPHLKIQHIIAQALCDAMASYKPGRETDKCNL
ncbi:MULTISPECIES: hypothetical protein [Bacillus]|uniref:hypothetical protein n=1 Tax=Bacillus TaxID=1386 RepID=UPI00037B3FFF|nr:MULTISPECIES: hypothetical protein [Bacillus]HWO76109.1 hypothetical protein [Bacillus sp. (in: firmicutes)]KAA0815884.1 hypothetical protein EI978_00760 [Bacillus licheniformis]KAA0819384.1 hypothetical protein EI976_21465 [Bacillus licheniformis]KAA0844739.1 hypothetical protein EI973_01205 [Bacillus licheniformis]MBC9089759.1 hypothetical protein [Bacillus sp. Y1]